MFSMILEKLFYCTDTGILDLYKYTRISWIAILKMNMMKIRLDVISRRRIHTNYFEWKKARFWLAAKNTISWWIIHAVLIWDRDRVFFFCSVYFIYILYYRVNNMRNDLWLWKCVTTKNRTAVTVQTLSVFNKQV